MQTKRFQSAVGPMVQPGHIIGTVIGVDADVAQVLLDTGHMEQVSPNQVRGKSFRPKANERWLLDRAHGGSWQFAVYLGTTDERAVGWQSPDFNTGWDHYSDPSTAWAPGSGHLASVAFRIDVDDIVRLRGTAAGPAVSTADTPGPLAADIFQLPDWALPDTDGVLRYQTASGLIKVYPDGWVRAASGSASQIALDGVAFLAV